MADIMAELRTANPAPADAEPHATAWSDAALLAEIDTRSGTDMSLDRKPNTQRAKATGSGQRWTKAMVAAAAFVAVLAVVGVVAFIGSDTPSSTTIAPAATTPTTSAPPTTLAPSTTVPVPRLSAEQQTFVDGYFEAWNSDVDAYLTLVAPDAEIFIRGGVWHPFSYPEAAPLARDRFEAIARWGAVLDSQATPGDCEPRESRVVCSFTMTDVLLDGFGSPVSGSIEFGLGDGVVESLHVRWHANNYYDRTRDFQTWLSANQPELASEMMVASGEPIYSEKSSELWQHYVPRYLGGDAPLSADEAAFVTDFVNAWNNDIEAYIALVAPEADVEHVGTIKYDIWVEDPVEMSREKFEARSRFEAAIGTRTDVNTADCIASDGAIVCPFTTTDIFIANSVVRVSGILEMQIADGRVQRLLTTWNRFNNAGSVNEFEAWAKANYASASSVNWYALSPELAALWNDLAPLYGAAN